MRTDRNPLPECRNLSGTLTRAPIAPEKATAPDRPDPLPEGPAVILGIYPAGDNDDAPVRSRIETHRSLFCVGGSDAP